MNELTILRVVVFVMVVLSILLVFWNIKVSQLNGDIITSWNEKQDTLISLCQIDLNEYWYQERAKTLTDFNKRYFGSE